MSEFLSKTFSRKQKFVPRNRSICFECSMTAFNSSSALSGACCSQGPPPNTSEIKIYHYSVFFLALDMKLPGPTLILEILLKILSQRGIYANAHMWNGEQLLTLHPRAQCLRTSLPWRFSSSGSRDKPTNME